MIEKAVIAAIGIRGNGLALVTRLSAIGAYT
jgi:hypothetical protein